MNTVKTKTKVSIRPFLNGLPNQGLELVNKVVGDGVHHKELLGFIERNNIKQYLTGLNESAPEVQGISDPEKKEAVIRDIRKTIVFLENALASNHAITEKDIDEYDEDGKSLGLSKTFWNKVTMFISQGPDKFDAKGNRELTYWDKVEAICTNDPLELNPNNPHDLILIYAIKAGGFTIVAPSLDAAKTAVDVPKFYLDKEEETASIRTEVKKLRNKAGAELDKMFNTDINKLFLITKLCAINSLSYRKTTPHDILYEDCDKFINGELDEKNKRYGAEKFIEYSELPIDTIRVQAIVRDATEMHLVTYKQDGQLYYNKTGTPMGKGVNDIVMFLKNPLNTDVLGVISDEVEQEWQN